MAKEKKSGDHDQSDVWDHECQNSICPTVIEIFQSGAKWWTDRPTPSIRFLPYKASAMSCRVTPCKKVNNWRPRDHLSKVKSISRDCSLPVNQDRRPDGDAMCLSLRFPLKHCCIHWRCAARKRQRDGALSVSCPFIFTSDSFFMLRVSCCDLIPKTP